MKNKETVTYEKHHSFTKFFTKNSGKCIKEQSDRLIKSLKSIDIDKNDKKYHVYKEIIDSLSLNDSKGFKVTPFIADEITTIDDVDLANYAYHRYRYDIYPSKKILDSYPPYLQIEPTSVCNYRCVFCYQTDSEFSNKKSAQMGNMTFETYKHIVDLAEGNIEFISLASRGEPLICKDLDKMLEYSIGKFLNLKVNTNASLMTESLCHSLLNGAVKTLVFSADAAEEELYSEMRVNGSLKKVLKNIERFKKIKEMDYPDNKIITRVSGVMFDDRQNMESMQALWANLVDQISFVNYNPWENIYDSEINTIKESCSDLWRRMFIWFDGSVNPCDSDYKSLLKVGEVNDLDDISTLWKSDCYMNLRNKHLQNERLNIEPCRRCSVI